MAACSSHDPRANRPHPVFSPNGEMLTGGGKGAPACPDALGSWWDKVAGAQGGVLTKDVFIADANAAFDVMDLDHDGFITPSELSDYRANIEEPYEDNVPSPDVLQQKSDAAAQQRRGQGRRRGDLNGEPALQPRQYSQIPADVVDPVMSADKSLSFKVDREAFLAQAHDVFADLDKNHDGKLSREEVTASCPAR